MVQKPNVPQKEIDKLTDQFENFDKQVKDLTLDAMNKAPVLEQEPQTKLSQKEIDKSKDIYLKPKRTISSREKFNESFREAYNFAKEYVQFIAENKEIIGESLDLWTKPFAGMPAEEWEVPTNKPVWGPRYLAEQIKKASYHRLQMIDKNLTSDGAGTYYGQMVATNIIHRLDAAPVSNRRSVFMGANNF